MFYTEFADKNVIIPVKGFEPAISYSMRAQYQQDSCEIQDLEIDSNSCFSDLSDSLNSCSI